MQASFQRGVTAASLMLLLTANGVAAGAAFWAAIRFWPANQADQVDTEVFA